MAIVFADESGRNDPPVYVMAGLIASPEGWQAFDAAWQEELAAPPAIPVFKMKEAHHGNGEFRGIPKADREAKCVRLSGIIRRYCVGRISVVTFHEAYDAIIRGRISRDVDDPYILSFDMLLSGADSLATALKYDGPIDFYFDRQIDKEPLLNAHWEVHLPTLDQRYRARFANKPSFLTDEEASGLQAADMLAWHIRRAYADGHGDLAKVGDIGAQLAAMSSNERILYESMLTELRGFIHKSFFRNNRLTPHAEDYLRKTIAMQTTCENYLKMMEPSAEPGVELMPLPASGTARYRLVHSCEFVDNPHLHRRSDNSCIEQTSAE